MPSTPLRLVVAAAAGSSMWLAFPPVSLAVAGPLGVALFLAAVLPYRGVALRARSAALVGMVAGLAFFVPLLSWLAAIGIDAWLALAAVEAVFLAALAIAVGRVSHLPGWWAWTACLWVAEEALRSRVPFGGFSWGRLAFAQPGGPWGRYAALGGAPVVSLVVAVLGALVVVMVRAAWAIRAGGRRSAVRRGLGALLGVAALTGLGFAVPVPTGGQGAPASAVVAVVQGNVPRLGLDAFSQARAVTRDHAEATEQLAAEVAAGRLTRPDLVIWPENSSDYDPITDPQARALVTAAVRAIGVPVLVGAILNGPGDHARNVGLVWDPVTGPGAMYVKRHLVPFGEYVPLRSVLAARITRFARIPIDFVSGRRPGVLTVGPVRLADVICFEVAWDGVVRDAVRSGGRLLAVQTNNATFEHPGDSGRGGESAQQLDITRLRAIEHGRAAVVVATSGVSAVIAPDGRVRYRSGVFVQAMTVTRVPLRDSLTVADRVGAWPEWTLTAIALGALGATAGSLRRVLRRAGE